MSSTQITVREFIEKLKRQNQDALVAVLSDEDNWIGECFVDGPEIIPIKMCDVRSGFDLPEYHGYDVEDCFDVVVLSDTCHSEEHLREMRQEKQQESDDAWEKLLEEGG